MAQNLMSGIFNTVDTVVCFKPKKVNSTKQN